MASSRLADTKVRLLGDGAARRDLAHLRQRAVNANLRTFAEAVNAFCNSARIISLDGAVEIARLGRAVTREADRVAALKRLREYERSLVERGLAEWLEADG